MSIKLLYISRNTNGITAIGGNIGRKIHEEALSQIFKDDICKLLLSYKETKSIKLYFYKLFFLYFPEITFSTFKQIKKIITKKNPDMVFIESSQHGNIAKFIKKRYPKILIITHFHNIELQYAKTLPIYKPKSWWFSLMAKKNETQAVKFSDKYIVLNKRDENELKKIYKRKADCILPVSLKDAINTDILQSILAVNHIINTHTCLFIGSNFEANIQGLKWFIKQVLSYVNLHLYIVGQGMTEVFTNNENITVKDFVEDLREYYINTDFIIEPIFSGGGMKTKTAEAMMWGKAIIGTDEAFCGYEIDDINGLYRCNTSQEMINKIEMIYNDEIYFFNPAIRELFLRKYSFNNTIKTLEDFFDH